MKTRINIPIALAMIPFIIGCAGNQPRISDSKSSGNYDDHSSNDGGKFSHNTTNVTVVLPFASVKNTNGSGANAGKDTAQGIKPKSAKPEPNADPKASTPAQHSEVKVEEKHVSEVEDKDIKAEQLANGGQRMACDSCTLLSIHRTVDNSTMMVAIPKGEKNIDKILQVAKAFGEVVKINPEPPEDKVPTLTFGKSGETASTSGVKVEAGKAERSKLLPETKSGKDSVKSPS